MTTDTRLTAEERAEARRLADAATPGPWSHLVCREHTATKTAEWLYDCAMKGGPDFHLVQSSLPPALPDEENPTVCTPGNGPTSEANASFIAASRTLVPKLLDALDHTAAQLLAAERERDEARAQVETLVVALREIAEDAIDIDGRNGERARAALKAAGVEP